MEFRLFETVSPSHGTFYGPSDKYFVRFERVRRRTLTISSHAQRNQEAKEEARGLERGALTPRHLGQARAARALVKDLYETAAENRDFIQARCQTGESGGEALEKYRHKIVARSWRSIAAKSWSSSFPLEAMANLSWVRRARPFGTTARLPAAPRHPGTAELLMTYVENGAEFTHLYGDMDERFYSSVESALDELATLLIGEAAGMYPQFSERLARVDLLAGDIGWGFGDYVGDVVLQLEDELGD